MGAGAASPFMWRDDPFNRLNRHTTQACLLCAWWLTCAFTVSLDNSRLPTPPRPPAPAPAPGETRWKGSKEVSRKERSRPVAPPLPPLPSLLWVPFCLHPHLTRSALRPAGRGDEALPPEACLRLSGRRWRRLCRGARSLSKEGFVLSVKSSGWVFNQGVSPRLLPQQYSPSLVPQNWLFGKSGLPIFPFLFLETTTNNEAPPKQKAPHPQSYTHRYNRLCFVMAKLYFSLLGKSSSMPPP